MEAYTYQCVMVMILSQSFLFSFLIFISSALIKKLPPLWKVFVFYLDIAAI